ncbi:MAG: hypothetical protein PF638_08210 [Candidatus Delongbacteria bacterium]|jgi:hypothetical protein|nr:hypothetical protein [Candidatus Delongbacteria bacterium]
MDKKKDSTKILKIIILISAILFGILGLAMIIFDQAYIKGIQYILTAGIYSLALNMIKQGKLILQSSKDRKTVNLNLGFIFSVIGITSPLGSSMFAMWALGIILFLMGMFYKKKEEKS